MHRQVKVVLNGDCAYNPQIMEVKVIQDPCHGTHVAGIDRLHQDEMDIIHPDQARLMI